MSWIYGWIPIISCTIGDEKNNQNEKKIPCRQKDRVSIHNDDDDDDGNHVNKPYWLQFINKNDNIISGINIFSSSSNATTIKSWIRYVCIM